MGRPTEWMSFKKKHAKVEARRNDGPGYWVSSEHGCGFHINTGDWEVKNSGDGISFRVTAKRFERDYDREFEEDV